MAQKSPIKLNDVTLIGIEGEDINRFRLALKICLYYCDFADVKILTPFDRGGEYVIAVPPLSYEDYNRYVIKELYKYVQTSHALLIQSDGFILNPEAWTDEFLEYDYIGAPWWFDDDMNVGNGGFTLRSRRFLETTARYVNGPPWHPEDMILCRVNGRLLREKGMKFAPEDLARRFSIEGNRKRGFQWDGEFGFHDLHLTNLGNWQCPPINGMRCSDIVEPVLALEGTVKAASRGFRSVQKRLRRVESKVDKLQSFFRWMLLESAAREAGYTDGAASMSDTDLQDLAVSVFAQHPQGELLGVHFRPDEGSEERQSVGVDCEKRWPICHGACCTLKVHLTKEEVRNPVYHIDVTNPFSLLKDKKTGLCTHWINGKCGIYENRPLACKAYTCAIDKRIWKDFGRMTPGEIPTRYEERMKTFSPKDDVSPSMG